MEEKNLIWKLLRILLLGICLTRKWVSTLAIKEVCNRAVTFQPPHFFYKNGPKLSYDSKLFLDELQNFWLYHFYIRCKAKFFIYWILVSLFRPKCKNLDSWVSKGQIISDCIYEIINFPRYHRKNLIDFCSGRFYRLGTSDLWLFSRRLYSGECITYLVWMNFKDRNLSNFFQWYFGKLMISQIHSDIFWPLANSLVFYNFSCWKSKIFI